MGFEVRFQVGDLPCFSPQVSCFMFCAVMDFEVIHELAFSSWNQGTILDQ